MANSYWCEGSCCLHLQGPSSPSLGLITNWCHVSEDFIAKGCMYLHVRQWTEKWKVIVYGDKYGVCISYGLNIQKDLKCAGNRSTKWVLCSPSLTHSCVMVLQKVLLVMKEKLTDILYKDCWMLNFHCTRHLLLEKNNWASRPHIQNKWLCSDICSIWSGQDKFQGLHSV